MTSITAYEILSTTKGRRFGENPFKEDDEQIQEENIRVVHMGLTMSRSIKKELQVLS